MDTLRKYIQQNKIIGEVIDMKAPMTTAKAASELLGCAVSNICKTIILKIKKQYVAIILQGDAKIDFILIGKAFDINPKRIRFANSDEVLTITGYPAGGTPPCGFTTEIETIIDQDIADQKREIYAGGGRAELLLKIAPQEIVEKTNARPLKVSVNS